MYSVLLWLIYTVIYTLFKMFFMCLNNKTSQIFMTWNDYGVDMSEFCADPEVGRNLLENV